MLVKLRKYYVLCHLNKMHTLYKVYLAFLYLASCCHHSTSTFPVVLGLVILSLM